VIKSQASKLNREIFGLDQGKGPSDQGKPVPAPEDYEVTRHYSKANRCDSPQNVLDFREARGSR
jgi:hypothetical protein